MADDAGINEVVFGIGAGAVDRTRIPDLVAGFELANLVANFYNLAHGVPTEDHWRTALGSAALADFRVDRVNRHGLDLDEDVMAGRGGFFDLKVDQGVGAVNCAINGIADSFHFRSPEVAWDARHATVCDDGFDEPNVQAFHCRINDRNTK